MKRLLVLFLLSWPLAAQNALYVDLSGEWRRSADDDPRYAQPAFDDSGWALVRLPWEADRPRRETAATFWVRRTVEMPAGTDLTRLALTLGSIAEAYELFVNGTRIGRAGGFSNDEAQIARARTFRIPEAALAGPGRQLHVAVRLWTPQYMGIGAWFRRGEGPYAVTYAEHAPSTIGELALIRDQWRLSRRLATISIMAVLGMVLLLAWLANRREDQLLWFALFLTASVSVAATQILLLSPDSYPFGWRIRNYGLNILRVVLFIEFAMAFFRLRWRLARIAIWSSWAWVLIEALREDRRLAGTPPQRLIEVLGALVLAMGWWQLIRRRDDRARWLIASASLLTYLTIINFNGLFNLNAFGLFGLNGNLVATTVLSGLIAGTLFHELLADRRAKQQLAAEMEAARAVQQLLLPHSSVSSAEFAVEAVYEPAMQVGGDFHWRRVERDGSLVVVVGDVSGKGLKAAMLVSVAVGILRNEKAVAPAAILSALNEGLTGHTGGGFVTACCARFEVNGPVTVANAGHPAPYGDGRELEVEAGLPLGVVAGAAYEESVVRGQCLTFVSDGVVEAENAQRELFGFERTREISTKSAREIAEAARAWGQNDDITVVTVRRSV